MSGEVNTTTNVAVTVCENATNNELNATSKEETQCEKEDNQTPLKIHVEILKESKEENAKETLIENFIIKMSQKKERIAR